jgi:hypothetical protein
MLALKNIPLEREMGNRIFGMVIEHWFNLNAQRWQPGTIECIIREFLRPLHKLPPEQVDRIRIKILFDGHISPAYVQKQLGHRSFSMTRTFTATGFREKAENSSIKPCGPRLVSCPL